MYQMQKILTDYDKDKTPNFIYESYFVYLTWFQRSGPPP